MKKNNGITLLEILVAVALLAFVILAGSGIYLSGWNLFKDARYRTQAARNALIPMMHMQENLRQAISFTNQSATDLWFRQYTNISLGQETTRRYIYNSTNRILQYDSDTTNGNEVIIGTFIRGFRYTISHNATSTGPTTPGIIANITITASASDVNDVNRYNLTSIIEAGYGSAP